MIKFISIAFSCFFILGAPQISFAKKDGLDHIVAIVNNQVITNNQLNHQLDIAKQQMAANHMPVESEKQLRQKVLNHMIDQELQLQLAKETGIKAEDKEVDAALAQIAKEHNLPVSQLPEVMAKQQINYAQFRKEIRDNITISHLLQKAVGSQIKITEEELRHAEKNPIASLQSPTEYHLQDLIVALPEKPESALVKSQYELALQLKNHVQKGASFDEAATQSTAKGLAVSTADLDWRTLNDMPALFAKEAKNMKINEIRGPFRTANGFHLVQLLGTRGIHNNQFMKNGAKEMLYRRKFEEAAQKWLKEVRNQAYIKIMEEK